MKCSVREMVSLIFMVTAVWGNCADEGALVKLAKSGDGMAILQVAKKILVYDTERQTSIVQPNSRDARQAYRLIKKAASVKCGEAIFIFGVLLENDRQTIGKFQNAGFDLYPIIESADFREENSILGNRPIDESNVRTAEKVVALYRRAVESGYPAAEAYAREMDVRVKEFRGKMDKRAVNSSVVDEILNDDTSPTGESEKFGEPEVKKVRLPSARLGLSRPKGSSVSYVRGQLRVEFSFSPRRFKRPVIRVTCLCDVDGAIRFYEGFYYTPNTYDGMGRNDLYTLFEEAGEKATDETVDELMHDAKKISYNQKEVDRDKFATVVYGSSNIDAGYFVVDDIVNSVKMLLYRVEVWQNGVMVKDYESAHTGLNKYEIPSDWYVWHKYPAKYKYIENATMQDGKWRWMRVRSR